MKMKKLSIGMGIALCAAFGFMLTSCEGSKKITYLDENGEEQTVTVKKSSDSEEIANSLTALVYSKGSTKFKPNGVGISASVEANLSGVQVSNNKKFNYGGSASAKAMFTFGDYEKTENDESILAYAEVNASVKVPTAAFDVINNSGSLIANDVLLTSLSETEIDYTETTTVSAKARAYGNKDGIYVNLQKLDVPYDKIEQLKKYKQVIENNFIGKYAKIDENLVPELSILSSLGEYAKSYYSMYEGDSTFVDYVYGMARSELSSTEFKENLKNSLDNGLNLVISSVDGNKITLKYSFASKDPQEGDYAGKSYVSVSFDMVKKVPTAVKADLGDYANYYLDQKFDGQELPVKDYKATLKGSVEFSYSPKVPKISKKDADNAFDISALMS